MFMSFYACVVVYFISNNIGTSTKPPIAELPSKLRAEAAAMLVTDPTEKEEVAVKSKDKLKEREVARKDEPSDEPDTSDKTTGDYVDPDSIQDIVNAVVKCKTTHGDLIIDVREAWAPLGAARFLEMVDADFFTDLPIFRVCPKYLCQFGVKYADPKVEPRIYDGLKDDKNLMGVRDMDFGYLFFTVRITRITSCLD
jgi:hypothetical protein